MGKSARRKQVNTTEWVPTREAPPLPPFATALQTIQPDRRCYVVGLRGGDCQMQTGPHPDEHLCFYHRKVADGLITPEEPSDYPVYPLPKHGYVLVERVAAA